MIQWLSNFRKGSIEHSWFPTGLPRGHGQYDSANLLELGWCGLYSFAASEYGEKPTTEDQMIKATDEQKAFFKEIEYGDKNVILESVAGSGKTTSIVMALNYIDDAEPILACSFTKLAAQQLDRKIRANDFTNINSSTLNSVGWQACRANVRGCELDANKTLNILQSQLGRTDLKGLDPRAIYKAMQGPVKRIVGLLKSYVTFPDQAIAKAKEYADYHGVDIPEGTSSEACYARDELYKRIASVYQQSVECVKLMDFDDMKFFPVWHQWGMPKYKKIIVDEAQDCNVCDIELVKLLQRMSPGSRTIWVGDRMQSIYLFRGSLLNALDIIKDKFNCNYLTLSVCWRCADDILIEAKEINPRIKSPEPNPKGKGVVANVTTQEFLEKVSVGDFVICRTTAPLVKRCLQLVRQGTPAKVKGREVGRSLINLIDKVSAEMPGFDGNSNATLLEFIEVLAVYKTNTVAALEAAKRDEAATRVQDECESLTYFCTEARDVDSVVRKINDLFSDDDDDNSVVLLLTAHKAKGLESETVYFLRPDLVPFPKATSEHEKQVEKNLRYVILTRAALNRYHVQPEPDEVKLKKEAF